MSRKKKIAELEEEYYSDVYLDDYEEDEEEECDEEEPELCEYMGREYFDIEDYE